MLDNGPGKEPAGVRREQRYVLATNDLVLLEKKELGEEIKSGQEKGREKYCCPLQSQKIPDFQIKTQTDL